MDVLSKTLNSPACLPSESQGEVRASKALFEGIVEIAEDAIIAVDSNQCIILYNEEVMADIGNWIDAHLSAVAETKGRTQ